MTTPQTDAARREYASPPNAHDGSALSEVVELVHGADGAALLVPRKLVESARTYARNARAANTLHSYAADLKRFDAWCEAQGLCPLPAAPQTVGLYLAARADAGKKVATIGRELAAISQAHVRAGFESPRRDRHVVEVFKGIRNTLGVAQRRVAPVLVPELRAMVRELRPGLIGVRDRALLTLGFAGALRRSELVALCVEDLDWTREGLTFRLRRRKNNQEGKEKPPTGIPFGANAVTCPVRALRAWLDAANITDGPIFRRVDRHGKARGTLSDEAVALVIKHYAEAAGLAAERFSGHSLRRGLVTQSHRQGKSLATIKDHGGWSSVRALEPYIESDPFEDNAAAGIGL